MPALTYEPELKVYAKECAKCKRVFLGTDDVEESYKVFLKDFRAREDGRGCSDGLSYECRPCGMQKRRELGFNAVRLKEMWQDQQGLCLICNRDITLEVGKGTDKHACLDHDKVTGVVRGLLCHHCNAGIGSLQHNKEILESAIAYLERKQ